MNPRSAPLFPSIISELRAPNRWSVRGSGSCQQFVSCGRARSKMSPAWNDYILLRGNLIGSTCEIMKAICMGYGIISNGFHDVSGSHPPGLLSARVWHCNNWASSPLWRISARTDGRGTFLYFQSAANGMNRSLWPLRVQMSEMSVLLVEWFAPFNMTYGFIWSCHFLEAPTCLLFLQKSM